MNETKIKNKNVTYMDKVDLKSHLLLNNSGISTNVRPTSRNGMGDDNTAVLIS